MSSRLSQQQWQAAKRRAERFQQQVVEMGHKQGFAEVFRLAASLIEEDVDGFCDRAQLAFEEIEAFGQEPTIDDDWLDEVTGEKDNFYFSTDSLVRETEKLPPGNKGKGRRRKEPDEDAVVRAVEEAIDSLEDAMAVSHSENVQDWVEKIRHALLLHDRKLDETDRGKGLEFWHLQHITHLTPSALFLGLLLGHENWSIRQDSFYGEVMVKLNM
ncbi:MAG: hypothetical protein AAFV85_27560 [Cyanobacteria bacterium J06634_6]